MNGLEIVKNWNAVKGSKMPFTSNGGDSSIVRKVNSLINISSINAAFSFESSLLIAKLYDKLSLGDVNMSYTISENNIIRITRGDTFTFDFTIYDENSPDGRYILKNDDVLYLGLMLPHQPFENAIVKKRYTKEDCDEMGNVFIRFNPEDTLDLLPGVYYYSIKLHKMTDNDEEYIDEVITIINKTKFIICD